MQEHTYELTLPHELIDWARADHLAAPYMSELECLALRPGGASSALNAHEAVRVLACTEAAVYGACVAGRADLLMRLPVWLAKYLGLWFSWQALDGSRVEVGGREGWDASLEALRWADSQGAGREQALTALRAVGEAFGAGQIRVEPQRGCDRCGAVTVASVDLLDNVRYCGGCWSSLAGPATVAAPVSAPPPSRPTKRRK